MAQEPEERSYRLRRMGGEVDSNRILNVPGVVLLIAGLTVAAFLFLVFSPPSAAHFIETTMLLSPYHLVAGLKQGDDLLHVLSPLVGHMFAHGGLVHLGMNMIFLLAMGSPIARRMNAEGALQSFSAFAAALVFALFYFLSGVAGALTFVAMHPDSQISLVGASGGVSGLLGGLVRFAFNRSTLFGPETSSISPLTSSVVVSWTIFLIGSNIVMGLFDEELAGASIAWEAHVGGYLFGLLTYPLFERLARGAR